MDFTTLTVELLKSLSIVGGYGVGIILLTVIFRACLWPLGVSSQRSMRQMQKLQPKMKAIQDRYKNDPQVMQKKMMEFYKEHKFNPMSGCLPLLLQMPIFILLYSALMSPQFIQIAGDASFLFINRLDATLKGNAGVSYDGAFNTSAHDIFMINKNVKVFLGEEVIDNVKILDTKKALKVQGEVVPGENIDFKISLDELDLKFSQLEKVTSVEANIVDRSTKEIEKISFERNGGILVASVPTQVVQGSFHLDVLFLIILFAGTMYISQKVMMGMNKNTQMDPNQAAMQKMMGTMMPVMITATFIFIPIPAGVLVYLIVSNIIQVIQTVVINKQLERDEQKKKDEKLSSTVKDAKIKDAKKIEAKDIKTVKSEENKDDEEDS